MFLHVSRRYIVTFPIIFPQSCDGNFLLLLNNFNISSTSMNSIPFLFHWVYIMIIFLLNSCMSLSALFYSRADNFMTNSWLTSCLCNIWLYFLLGKLELQELFLSYFFIKQSHIQYITINTGIFKALINLGVLSVWIGGDIFSLFLVQYLE